VNRATGVAEGRHLVVEPRFCGPPGSANGGYVSGLLAASFSPDAIVEVTLRRPPPLGVRLDLSDDAGLVELRDSAVGVAEARTVDALADAPPGVPFDVADAAAARYGGRDEHPFPTCFVCGVDRDAGDGMRLEPGPVGDGVVAAVWCPHPTLADAARLVGREFVWAALDCPGGWSSDLRGRPMVLGRMTARVVDVPRVGDRCVVVGQLRGAEGRKAFTASALYGPGGELLAHAQATWFHVSPTA